MLCKKCEIQEAMIKYTEIINGVKTEHNLCFHCTKEMDSGQYSTFLGGESLLGGLLFGPLGLENNGEETDVRGNVVCPTCGANLEGLMESSRFGCADYYGIFDLSIKDRMRQPQGNESHKGKYPKYRNTFERKHPGVSGGSRKEIKRNTDCLAEIGSQDSQTAVVRRQIRELDSKLKKAMRQKDCGLVASHQDQIKELKKEAGIHE